MFDCALPFSGVGVESVKIRSVKCSTSDTAQFGLENISSRVTYMIRASEDHMTFKLNFSNPM